MSAFRDARDARPLWTPSEAPSSLHMDAGATELQREYESSPMESIAPLPNMQSTSGVEIERLKTAPTSYKATRPTLRMDSSFKSEANAPSRRSSTASVIQFFCSTPDSSVRVDWPSKESWAQVERDIGDVINADLQAARAVAEALGQVSPDRPKQYLGPTTSGVGIAGAMGVAARNKLTKRESVLVKRRKSNMDFQAEEPPVPPLPASVSANMTSKPNKKTKNRKPPKLQAVDIFSANAGPDSVDDGGIIVQSPENTPDSPTLLSQCSCTDASHGGSSSVSPAVETHPRPGRVNSDASYDIVNVHAVETYKPQRSRSMIDNVRGFFQQTNAPLARTVSISRLPSPFTPITGPDNVSQRPTASSTPTMETVRRKWRQSIRRRVGSDSKISSAEHPTASTSEPLLPARPTPLETIHSPGDELQGLDGIMTPRANDPQFTDYMTRPRMAGEHSRHTWDLSDFPVARGFTPSNSGSFASMMASAQPLVSSPDEVELHSTERASSPGHRLPSPLFAPPTLPPPLTPPPTMLPSTTKRPSSSSKLMSFFTFSRSPSDDPES